MKPLGEDDFVLSTGKVISANNHIIGLAPTNIDDEYVAIHEGYDGGLYVSGDKYSNITDDEAIEIADYMIQQWVNFKEYLKRKK